MTPVLAARLGAVVALSAAALLSSHLAGAGPDVVPQKRPPAAFTSIAEGDGAVAVSCVGVVDPTQLAGDLTITVRVGGETLSKDQRACSSSTSSGRTAAAPAEAAEEK